MVPMVSATINPLPLLRFYFCLLPSANCHPAAVLAFSSLFIHPAQLGAEVDCIDENCRKTLK